MFSLQIITNAGANLLRDAKESGKKVVLTRARAGKNADMERGSLCWRDADWYDVKTGSVSVVSNDLGFLHVSASFDAGSGSDPIKSICICGQLAKDGDNPSYAVEDDIVIAAVSDDNACFDDAAAFSVDMDLPVATSGTIDNVGEMYNAAGLRVVSFTPGESDNPGTLRIALDDGTLIDLSGTVHEAGSSDFDAYFTDSGSAGAADTSINTTDSYKLYDASGNAITFHADHTYECTKVYNRAGQQPILGSKIGSWDSDSGQLTCKTTQATNAFKLSITASWG